MKRNFDANLNLKGKQILKLALGGAHTSALTSEQEVFSCGLNEKGQLGLGVMTKIIPVFQKIRNFTSFSIIFLDCSDETSCALTSSGDLFVWGRNSDNVFGFSKRDSIIEPTRVSIGQLTLLVPN